MGKRESYLFCRMHDINYALKAQKGRMFKFVQYVMPDVLEEYVAMYPDCPVADAVLALSSFIAVYDRERQARYREQQERYGNEMENAVFAIWDKKEYFANHLKVPYDKPRRYTLYTIALVCIAGQKNELAQSMLDLIIQYTEPETDLRAEAYIWAALAVACDFEAWHDRKYGNPIIGPIEYAREQDSGKDLNECVSGDDDRRVYQIKVIFKEPVNMKGAVAMRFFDTCLRFGLESTEPYVANSDGLPTLCYALSSRAMFLIGRRKENDAITLDYVQEHTGRWNEDRIADFMMALCISLMQIGPFDYNSATWIGENSDLYSWTAFENRVRGQR